MKCLLIRGPGDHAKPRWLGQPRRRSRHSSHYGSIGPSLAPWRTAHG